MAAGAYMEETGEGDSTPGIEKFNALIKEKNGLRTLVLIGEENKRQL